MTGPTYQVVHQIRGRRDAKVALLAEHASNGMPPDFAWSQQDQWIAETHWAWDPGVREMVQELAVRFEAPAVLANFSRLLVDPNRAESSPGLIREHADGKGIHLNASVSGAERARRIERFHRPYHAAADRMAAAHQGPVLLSVHSFTPVYGGERRTIEVGVLWEKHDALNERLADAFEVAGLKVGRNEPYSGKEGLAYSVERHALRHGLAAVELELRQDLCVVADFRSRITAVLEACLGDLGL